MATQYQVSRIKNRKKKKCLSCGEWKMMVHGPGDCQTFGVCDECRYGQGYSEDDLNKQDVGE